MHNLRIHPILVEAELNKNPDICPADIRKFFMGERRDNNEEHSRFLKYNKRTRLIQTKTRILKIAKRRVHERIRILFISLVVGDSKVS